MMRTVKLPDGTEVPALGQGTWHMGERAGAAKAEVAARPRINTRFRSRNPYF